MEDKERLAIFTDEELKRELIRREMERDRLPEPIPKEDICLDKLYEACEGYLKEIVQKRYDTNDDRNWIFEAGIETIYGDIWDFINDHLD